MWISAQDLLSAFKAKTRASRGAKAGKPSLPMAGAADATVVLAFLTGVGEPHSSPTVSLTRLGVLAPFGVGIAMVGVAGTGVPGAATKGSSAAAVGVAAEGSFVRLTGVFLGTGRPSLSSFGVAGLRGVLATGLPASSVFGAAGLRCALALGTRFPSASYSFGAGLARDFLPPTKGTTVASLET